MDSEFCKKCYELVYQFLVSAKFDFVLLPCVGLSTKANDCGALAAFLLAFKIQKTNAHMVPTDMRVPIIMTVKSMILFVSELVLVVNVRVLFGLFVIALVETEVMIVVLIVILGTLVEKFFDIFNPQKDGRGDQIYIRNKLK